MSDCSECERCGHERETATFRKSENMILCIVCFDVLDRPETVNP
jgi:ribosomal protein S27E